MTDPNANLLAQAQNLEKSLRSARLDWLALKANNIHREVNDRVRQMAIDIWKIGRILRQEKQIVGYGNWLAYLDRVHPNIGRTTVERYLRVSEVTVDRLSSIIDKTPTQAYAVLGIIKQNRPTPSLPAGEEGKKSDSSQMTNLAKPSTSTTTRCPSCNSPIEVVRNGDDVTLLLSTRAA